jgi:2,4-dienoyl-CoA reductase-like NADH-dependent reductase (Old Yellow Enzyme family)
MTSSLLFQPLTLRSVESRNRIVVSPMCMYASPDGKAQSYHLAHLGRFALGGAGIVFAEATAVEARGRISSRDLGLWSDDQVDSYRPITRFLKEYGAVPAIQLAHAGRKAACRPPWRGNTPLTEKDAEMGDPPWKVIGPSTIAAGPDWQTPAELSHDEINDLVGAWAQAARRAVEAGFEAIGLHGAHGYLLHSFLSPIANHRTDMYGGVLENRMRLGLQITDAVRAAVPETVPLFYRISVADGLVGGLTMEDTLAYAQQLYSHGIDVIDTSSGGVSTDRSADARVRRGFAFHAPYAAEIRKAGHGHVSTVGLIVDARQAEAVLQSGDADLVFLAREMLYDPNWALHAQEELHGKHFGHWHKEASSWLQSRQAQIDNLLSSGETPMSRYEAVQRTLATDTPDGSPTT